MPLAESAEQKRIQALIDANPEGTRMGDDARYKMNNIMKNRAKEEQRQAGGGQFIQAVKTPSLRQKAKNR